MPSDLDETTVFQPKFNSAGLITAAVTDARDGALLMIAHMNADALRLTLETGELHFWSRSRRALWKKGETSGEILRLSEILVDCDQDALQVRAVPVGRGAACHTGRKTCFYRRIVNGKLEPVGGPPLFDPKSVYGR